MNLTKSKAPAVLQKDENVLSEEMLERSIMQLREMLISLGGGLLFFDMRSFYVYLDYFLNENDSRKVAKLLNKLEPYIPIVVSDEDVETFLDAAVRNDIDEVKQLEAEFKAKSKTKFIRALAQKDDDSWLGTVDTCRMLRNYRAEGMPV